MSTLISYQKAYLTKGTSFPGNLATLRFPVTGRIGPVTFVTVGSRNQPCILSFFLKGLRFITPKAFSELLKLSREYQMLTVTKVSVDAEPHETLSRSVVLRHESKVTEAFAYFDRHSIASK